VYTEVAALVREKVAADAASGDPWAPLLHDAIDRKLVHTSNATTAQWMMLQALVCMSA
jgi:DNA-directed RNA polymerase